MSHLNFVIPQNKNELLSFTDRQYFVNEVVGPKEIIQKLKDAKLSLKDEGPEYIIEFFDTYYSVLHHGDTLQLDIIIRAYDDLGRAASALNKNLGFLLEDQDSLNDDLKTKYLNIIKMLLYVYTNLVMLIIQKVENKKELNLQTKMKQRKMKAADENFVDIQHKDVLLILHNIMQRDIKHFWDPPIVEEVFISMVSAIPYRIMKCYYFKQEKDIRTEVFSYLGTLLKSYNHGSSFVVHLVQLIKMHEHLVGCVPEGIQLLVEKHNCKSLVRDFVREITEWQTDEKFVDNQGSRYCANVLSDMAALMPSLMIPEVIYLNKYLSHESYALRNSILNVITEIILNVLTKDNLSTEEKASRDKFLFILEEHIHDVSTFVRSKVFQHWARLQKENAIPVKLQPHILEKAVVHLKDKGAAVRKNAAICVKTFLTHNIFGCKLQLKVLENELAKKKEELDILKAEMEGIRTNKLKKIEEEWLKREADILEVVTKKLKEPDDIQEHEVAKNDLPELVRMYIMDKKYEEAFMLCRNAGKNYEEWKETRQNMNNEMEVQLFVALMHTIFSDIPTMAAELQKSAPGQVTETELTKLAQLLNVIDYLTDTMTFLKHIDAAIEPMQDLLESQSVLDMQEAIEFFIAAYKFNIDNSVQGILGMLRLMQRNEQDRKDAVVVAFKKIYMTTDSKDIQEHTAIVSNRLIELRQMVSFENYPHLTLIISDWVSKGILTNNVLDLFWQYFTKKIPASDEVSRAALDLLQMAALCRSTIITRNIKLVATLVFQDRKEDLLLVKSACEILAVAGNDKQIISSKNPPFKIKPADCMWDDLVNIVVNNFTKKIKFLPLVITAAVRCIYSLCSKPDKICEGVVERVCKAVNKEKKNGDELVVGFIIMRINHLLGEIATSQMQFLDVTVYKELKRRNYIRDEKNNAQSATLKKRESKALRNASSVRNASTEKGDEDTMDGAVADDTDADFVLNILENSTVTGVSFLGKLAHMIIDVCKNPEIYSDKYVQSASVVALLRYMLVSSKFCKEHMQLIITILERTTYPEIKKNILIHSSDLLERFPNDVEPWTPKLFDRLKDEDFSVRKHAFFMLSTLILKDMIRVQGHMSEMAICITDDEEELRDMSKQFFMLLADKANVLYNVLPDIFSHLCDAKQLPEKDLQSIMKFLFGLIDKSKQMENLVDRFCAKFKVTENVCTFRNIAYSLSLIHYNEKALKRLSDNFPSYKHVLQDNAVYATFKTLLNTASKLLKNESKGLVTEIEEKIKSVFEVDGSEQPKTPDRPTTSRSTNKKRPTRNTAKKSRKKPDSSDEDSDCEKENVSVSVRSSKRSRKIPRGKVNKRILECSSEESD